MSVNDSTGELRSRVMICAHFLLTAALAANPDLEKATKLVADLQYAEARSALEAAIKRTGNDRETMLRIYELQGIVYATLNDATKAGKAFQAMMVLDPERRLTGDYPPRVMTPFYEARGRAAELGKLELKALPVAVGNNRVGQLAVELSSDPLKMVKKVKFHVRQDGGAWVEMNGDMSGKTASVSVDASRVEWWADAVGDREAVVAQVGSEAAPRSDSATPVAAKDAPMNDPLAPPSPPPEEQRVSKSSGGMSGGRLAGIGMMAGGAIVVGLGVAFGVMADGSRKRIENADTNAQGQVTEITQREAYQLDGSVKTNATIANVMFGVGGALAAGGLILFLVSGSSSSSSVAVVPAGSGVAVSGTF